MINATGIAAIAANSSETALIREQQHPSEVIFLPSKYLTPV
ncbi:hypothetical protein [Pantanalinema sp. GBBB05]